MSPLAAAQVTEDLKLLPSDGASLGSFGCSAAISDTTTIIGATDSGTTSGSAYLFDAMTGQQLAKLLPADGVAADYFGAAVAIHGTRAIVGAYGDDDHGGSSGSAYLFHVATGQQIAKLLPLDGAAGDGFGSAVGISGTQAVVGAWNDDDNGSTSGSAYLFDLETGQQAFKLLPGDGAAHDLFGLSVAIDDTTVLVGAPRDEDNGYASGSAYLFDAASGRQLAKLLPNDGDANARFGSSVALSGTLAVVGAHGDDDNGTSSGSAYSFDLATGQQLAKLLPSDGAPHDAFGHSVAIHGSTVVVGSYGDDDSGSYSGAAYLFDAATGQQIAKLLPSDGAADDWFGIAVAISATNVVLGADGDDDNGPYSGSAYVFDILDDCNGNGIPDQDDIANGTSQDCDSNGLPDECQLADPAQDWNGDGILDACLSANYCDAAPNSTGVAATIGASGTPVAAANDFTLDAWDLPLHEYGYFLASESTTFVPGFGGTSGNLCVGSPQYRFNNPQGGGMILNSGSAGFVSFTLDLSTLPQGITFDAGEVWYFQLWYRDFTTVPTSNTTDGIEVMFR